MHHDWSNAEEQKIPFNTSRTWPEIFHQEYEKDWKSLKCSVQNSDIM